MAFKTFTFASFLLISKFLKKDSSSLKYKASPKIIWPLPPLILFPADLFQ